MIWKLLMTASAALVAGMAAETVRADEAYICDNGELIYVKSADVPRLKQSNPCVAKHFGIEITRPSPRAAQLHALPPEDAAAVGAPPSLPDVPAVRTIDTLAAGLVPVVRPVAFNLTGRGGRRAIAGTDTDALEAGAAAEPVTADYRNVRVINAQRPADAVYRHNR